MASFKLVPHIVGSSGPSRETHHGFHVWKGRVPFNQHPKMAAGLSQMAVSSFSAPPKLWFSFWQFPTTKCRGGVPPQKRRPSQKIGPQSHQLPGLEVSAATRSAQSSGRWSRMSMALIPQAPPKKGHQTTHEVLGADVWCVFVLVGVCFSLLLFSFF